MAAVSTSAPVRDLTERDVAALTEPMCVVVDDPDIWNDSEVAVYSGATRYAVSPATGFCECPDHHYRGRECKHLRRAAFALELREVPAWANRETIDPVLAAKLEDA